MGKKEVVLDTNVLISALGWNGKPREIFRKVLEGELTLIICKNQIQELKRVLDYPKLKFTNEQKIRFLDLIYEIAIIIEIDNKLNVIKEDLDDNMILESAIVSNAGFIISGDEHLLKLKEYSGIKILTPKKFIS